MNIPRQEALFVAGLLFLAGGAFVLIRLFRARRLGVSLRMQVFLAVGLITLVLTATFAVIVVDRFSARTAVFAYRAALDEARMVSAFIGRPEAPTFDSTSKDTLDFIDKPILSKLADAFSDTRLQVLDTRCIVRFDSEDETALGRNLSHRPEAKEALKGKADPVTRVVGKNKVAAAAPILENGEIKGAVRAVKSTFNFREVLSNTAPKVALLALVLALTAALAGAIIGRFMSAPIERLTRAAERVSKGKRQGALPPPAGREVRALTAAFESMRGELEQRNAVASLAADVSHELKNPVAAMRAAAEVLEDAVLTDREAALKFARRIQESASKMDALIHDLLSLARLEARGIANTAKEFDATYQAWSAAEESERFADADNVRISVEAPGPLFIKGDAAWVKRAVSNLIGNAVSFSPQGGEVSVQLSSFESGVEIVVTDAGPGIDEALRNIVFERFTTSRRAEGGTGLGLAIVRAVAEAHGGTAEIRATGPNGTSAAFTICRIFD